MREKTMNCWESKNCGRELNGKNTLSYGPCPAAIDSSLNGVHGGRNGGRCCWVVKAYTHDEETECQQCNFFELVRKENELLITV